MFGYEKDSVQ